MEVIRQQEGNNSTLRVQVAAIQCDECGAIPWDELQVSKTYRDLNYLLFSVLLSLSYIFLFYILFLLCFLNEE